MSAADVVVMGGGPIGLASAWRAAQAGLSVTVCDPAPGGGAADVAAGMLAAVTEAWFGEEELTALAVESARQWPGFAAEVETASGCPVGLTSGGTLVVAYDADDRALVHRAAEHYDMLGLGAERLRSRAVRDLEPALSPRVTGGLLADGDHRVDPRTLCTALLAAGREAGVQMCPERVARVETDGHAATGVELDTGERIAAGAVVLAAGAWSSKIDGIPAGSVPPVRPVNGEIVTLRTPADMPPLLSRSVRAYVRGTSIYLVPRDDGRILVGATVDERGFDATVTAGGIYQLLRDATALVPGIDELEIAELRAGLRPGSPDNAPIIGWSEVDRLLIASGHFRNGILLTPITADAVAALLTGREPPPELKACDPGRFR